MKKSTESEPFAFIRGGLRKRLRAVKRELPHIGFTRLQLKPLIVVTSERSGSTAFMDLMEGHAAIISDPHDFLDLERVKNEWTKPRYQFTRSPFRAYKFGISTGKRWEVEDYKNVFSEVCQNGGTILHLLRKQVIAQALSIERAANSGVLHQKGAQGKTREIGIEISPDRFVWNLIYLAKRKSFEIKILNTVKHVSLDYKEDICDLKQRLLRLNGLLEEWGLTTQERLEANYRKLSEKPAHESVVNREAFMDCLKTALPQISAYRDIIDINEWSEVMGMRID